MVGSIASLEDMVVVSTARCSEEMFCGEAKGRSISSSEPRHLAIDSTARPMRFSSVLASWITIVQSAKSDADASLIS